MASAFTCFIDGDQSREQTAHFIQLHSISICRRESKTDGNSKHLGQVCNPMHLQLSGAFLIHFADQPSCAWMEANWSSTWVMQPRMWQMPKSVWKKLEKNRADGCGWRGDAWRCVEHSTHASVDDDIFENEVVVGKSSMLWTNFHDLSTALVTAVGRWKRLKSNRGASKTIEKLYRPLIS